MFLTLTHPPAAYKASQYIEQFVKQGAIVPEPSLELDEIYAKYASRPPLLSSSSLSPSNPSYPASGPPPSASQSAPPYLLLSRHAIPVLERALNLPLDGSFKADVLRALKQAHIRLGVPGDI